MVARRVFAAAVLVAAAMAPTSPAGAVARTAAGRGDEAWDPVRAHAEAGAVVSRLAIPKGKHVRYVAANGDNAGSGSSSSPWRTVRHAIDRAPEGGVIVVYGKHRGRGNGVYAEQSWGTIETAGLTIQAYPGEQPLFKGSRTLSTKRRAWKHTATGWYRDVTVRSADRWPANPYPIDDQVTADRPQADDSAQLFLGPDLSTATALDEMDRDQWDATADAAGIRHVPAGRFFVEPPAGGRESARIWIGTDPTGSTVEWSTRQQAVRIDPGGHDTRIVGIAFVNYSPPHGNTLGTIRVLANGIRLEDVSVTRSAGTAIAASGENGTLTRPVRNLTLTRVTASDNGALGAAIGDAGGEGADDDVHNRVTIEYSRFDHNNREGFDVADCADGAHCAIAGVKLVRLNGVVVRYSSVSDNDATGIWCDLFCDRASIVGNYVAGNSMSGIYYEVSRRATIASNVVAGNTTVGSERGPGARRAGGVKITGSTGVVVEHNTFADNRRQQMFVASDRRDDGPVWHTSTDGEPSVAIVANLFVEGAAGDRLVLGTLDGEAVAVGWLAGSNGNGYLVSADRRPGPGDDANVAAPTPGVFASAATGDYRVVDPAVGRWTGAPLSVAARRTLHLDRRPTELGAVVR